MINGYDGKPYGMKHDESRNVTWLYRESAFGDVVAIANGKVFTFMVSPTTGDKATVYLFGDECGMAFVNEHNGMPVRGIIINIHDFLLGKYEVTDKNICL